MVRFKWLKRLFVILVTISLFFVYLQKQDNRVSLENSSLIRLHVIANSDREEDQNLKRKIRDRIIAELGPLFENSENLNESREIISKNINKISEIASKEVEMEGYNQSVEVNLGVYPFPTKWYGNFVLPAGKYEALRVVLGEGKGANWWCVLFPPLCFVDVSNNIANEPEQIKKVLSQKGPEVKVKFKVVELLESAKDKLENIIASSEEP